MTHLPAHAPGSQSVVTHEHDHADEGSASQRVRAVYRELHTSRAVSPTLQRLVTQAGEEAGLVSQDGTIAQSELDSVARHLRLTSNCRLLDLCCGSGLPGIRLAQRTGCHAVGIDLLSERLTAARTHAARAGVAERTQFLEADANRRLPFPDQHFDAVTLFDALVHIPDKPALLREINRVLRSGSWMALCTVLETRQIPAHELDEAPGTVWRIDLSALRAGLGDARFTIHVAADRTAQVLAWHERRFDALQVRQAALRSELGASGTNRHLRRAAQVIELLRSGAWQSELIIAERC